MTGHLQPDLPEPRPIMADVDEKADIKLKRLDVAVTGPPSSLNSVTPAPVALR